MKRFKYIDARSLKNAVGILGKNGPRARVLAGGTDLLGEMKDDILPYFPEVVVNIKNIAGLDHIRDNGRSLTIGALTRIEDIARNETVREKYTALAQAAQYTASPHIRDMGTIAGNICQNNRCWYYWVPDNRFDCIRKGGKECYALTGDARYHSIFGAMRAADTPCSKACPANVDIPAYLEKIRDGNFIEAAKLLLNSNPLPAITGRVCPHVCETDCNRGNYDEAVSIRCIERFLGDYILENQDELYQSDGRETGKQIAIVGSGPAGLSAAYYLRRCGNSITIYERMNKPGGLLMHGIPPYRLPKDIVVKQITAIERLGIQILLRSSIDKPETFNELTKKYDAVFIACGAWKEKPAGIKGEQEMLSGAEFLRTINSGTRSIPGKEIAVIGGGNVALDVARSLLRLGVQPVVIYRRTQNEMPALGEEIDRAEEEGIVIKTLTMPVEAKKQDDGILLTCQKMKLGSLDRTGRPRPIPIKNSEFTARYDAVIKATGEEPDISFLPKQLVNDTGSLNLHSTSSFLRNNVFAGGDFVTGPSTVVAAITAGRKAASEIDGFLRGSIVQNQSDDNGRCNRVLKYNSSFLLKTRGTPAPELKVSDRIKSIDLEENHGLDSGSAENEANRCFNCGCVAINSSDIAPALIAFNAHIKTTKRVIPADSFFTVNERSTTVLDDDEIVIEIEIPQPDPDSRSTFIKFALRRSIDFPVLNCAASVATDRHGKVKEARLSLNSVFNIPYRAFKAEAVMLGKTIDETTAGEAAQIELQNAFPLINNSYKIHIARALLKRAILACRITR